MKLYDGFSLIELAIVLALLGIMIKIVMVNGTYMHHLVAKQEIEKLSMICRYLQHAAMMSNVPKVLIFERAKRSYSYDGSRESLPISVEFGVLAGAKGPPSNPTRQIESPITFENERIIFHPDGIIQPGTVYLISKDKQVMYALSSPVSQVSYMRIYRYDGSWNCLS